VQLEAVKAYGLGFAFIGTEPNVRLRVSASPACQQA
jgi:hypothetical protein